MKWKLRKKGGTPRVFTLAQFTLLTCMDVLCRLVCCMRMRVEKIVEHEDWGAALGRNTRKRKIYCKQSFRWRMLHFLIAARSQCCKAVAVAPCSLILLPSSWLLFDDYIIYSDTIAPLPMTISTDSLRISLLVCFFVCLSACWTAVKRGEIII